MSHIYESFYFRIYGLPRHVISPVYDRLPEKVKEKLQEFLITANNGSINRLINVSRDRRRYVTS